MQNNSGKDQTYTVVVEVISKDANGKVISQKTLNRAKKVSSATAVSVDVGNWQVGSDVDSVRYAVKVFDENGQLVDSLEPDEQRVVSTVPLAISDSFVLRTEGGRLSRTFEKEATAILEKGDVSAQVSSSLVDGAQALIVDKMKAGDHQTSVSIKNRLVYELLTGSAQNAEGVKAVLEQMVNSTDSEGLIKYYPQSYRGDAWLTASVLQILNAEKWSLSVLPQALKAKLDLATLNILKRNLNQQMSDQAWWELQVQVAASANSFGGAKGLELANLVADKILGASDKDIKAMSNSELIQALDVLAALKKSTVAQSKVWQELTTTARISKIGNQALLEGQPFFSGWYSDEVLNTGKLLRHFGLARGSADLARALAVGLVQSAQQKWYIPETVFWVEQGLNAFANAYESDKVSGKTEIAVINEGSKKTVDWTDADAGLTMKTPWATASETVQVVHQGRGEPWVTLTARTAVPLKAPKSQGLSIEKTIKNMTRSEGFQTGDIVQVTIKVQSASQMWHVSLIDPIPAGSNIVGEGYGSFSSAEKSYRGYQVYFEYLGQGESELTYQYQLNNVGTFQLPPTQAEGLYLPSVSAQIPNNAVVVK